MVTITLMGDLQTTEGERALGCEVEDSITVKQLIRKQGKPLREIFQLLKQKKVMVTVNKRIASEATKVYDGDAVHIVAHDGLGRSGLTPVLRDVLRNGKFTRKSRARNLTLLSRHCFALKIGERRPGR